MSNDVLYLPTSSTNFNNIFSTESISPLTIYENRNFGYRRFTLCPPNPYPYTLLLYDKLPAYDIDNPDQDDYPMIIALDREFVSNKIRLARKHDNIQIFSCDETIYIHPKYVRVFFLSDQHMKTTLLKAEPSLETKLLPGYKERLHIIGGEEDNFKWTEDILSGIDPIKAMETLDAIISSDAVYNKLKGFMYSFIIGVTRRIPHELMLLKKLSRKIANTAISYLNTINHEPHSVERNKKSSNFKSITLNSDNYRKVLRSCIDDFSRVLYQYQQPNKDMGSEAIEYLIKLGIHDDCAMKCLESTRGLNSEGKTLYDHFIIGVQEYNRKISSNNRMSPVDRIEELINLYLSGRRLSYTNLYEQVSDQISEVESYVDSLIISHCMMNPEIPFDSLKISNKKLSDFSHEPFNERQNETYSNLVNYITELSVWNSEDFKNKRSEICIHLGTYIRDKISEGNKNSESKWNESPERHYMNSLLDWVETNKAFDVRQSDSLLLKSFAVFIMSADDLDKMINLLVDKEIVDVQFALGLWGATFGFSALPKTMIKSPTEGDSHIIQLMDYLIKRIPPAFEQLKSQNKTDDVVTIGNDDIESDQSQEIQNRVKNIIECESGLKEGNNQSVSNTNTSLTACEINDTNFDQNAEGHSNQFILETEKESRIEVFDQSASEEENKSNTVQSITTQIRISKEYNDESMVLGKDYDSLVEGCGRPSEEELNRMKKPKLKEIADQWGISTKSCWKKEDYVRAILSSQKQDRLV